jgi:hypothetical protein
MKQEIVSIIKDLVGHQFLYFNTALLIKLSPHSWPLAIWAICVSPSDQIYVMDNAEEWHELKTSDINYDKVLSTIYQRVKTIKPTYKTAI